MRYFAVVSWGAAATNWLARALNSHPDIMCFHAGNQALQASDDLGYFAELHRLSDQYGAVGDVHGVSRFNVPALQAQYGDAFRAVSLVREPKARVRSAIALGQRHGWPIAIAGDRGMAGGAQAAGYDWEALTPEQRYRLNVVNMLNAVVDEDRLGSIYRMEDLTREASALMKLIDDLSGGEVDASLEWCKSAVSAQATNSHVARADTALDDFTEQALYRMVSMDAWAIYDRLGYAAPYFLLELAGKRGGPRAMVA